MTIHAAPTLRACLLLAAIVAATAQSGCPSGGSTWTEDGITYHCAGTTEIGGGGVECDGELTCYLDEGCMIQTNPCPPGMPTDPDSFGAYLKGKFQVPAVRSPAWGYAHLSLVNDTYAVVDITVHDITDTFAAHVHNGTVGTNGPVVLPIYTFQAPGFMEAEPQYVSGTFSTSVAFDPSAIPGFYDLIDFGLAYVNVHTMAYPGGELRGQLYPGK